MRRPGDDRPGAVIDLAPGLVLVEAQMQKPRMKLPDCETPRLIVHLTPPASGLGVPASSGAA